MKKILTGILILFSTVIFANEPAKKTDLNKNWSCTTNASSTDVPADKTKDNKMDEGKYSAQKAFKMAEKNCRDCTEITCKKSD